MSIKARARHDIVIVEPESESKVIIIDHCHKGHVGRIVAVGPGETRENLVTGKRVFVPMQVEVGDRVLFSWRAGMEETIDGTKYLIMREKDIECVVDDDAVIGMTESRDAWDMSKHAVN